MKSDFVTTAAHELRTPLTSIRGFSELLLTKTNLEPEKKTRFLTHINQEATHLASIIGDLLDISRIESGQGISFRESFFDIAEIIRKSILSFQESSGRHGFEAILPQAPVPAWVDKEKLGQVLENLFSNAVKYSPDGGVIQVALETQNGYYHVSVADQGIGMTPEQVARIFEKFYRANASNATVDGTGLGMTIVKHLVEAHNGRIWVESEIGKGTTVKFTIPIFSWEQVENRKGNIE